jgi:hypothetical protein
MDTATPATNHLTRERRATARARQQASLQIRNGSSQLGPAAVVEFTMAGARFLAEGYVHRGDSLSFVLDTPRVRLEGRARVAWLSPLGAGRCMVGVEFVNPRLSRVS